MRISDWSSDVCSSDLHRGRRGGLCSDRTQDWRVKTRPVPPPESPPPAVMPDPGWYAAQCRSGYNQRASGADPGHQAGRKRAAEGKSVSVRLDLGGRSNIETKNQRTCRTRENDK